MNSRKSNLLKCAAAFVLLTSVSAYSQVNSNTADVTLNATITEALTVAIDNTVVNFGNVASGQTATPVGQDVHVTTTWTLATTRSSVVLYAYFTAPLAAMTMGTNDIPASALSATVGGSSVGSFSTVDTFGTGVTLQTTPITTANDVSSATADVALTLNLSSVPNLPAGAYTGTMYIQAQAN
jgi:hypothetical protein